MTQILSKYSQSKRLDKSATQVNPTAAQDTRVPYTFLEWQRRNVGIIPGKEREQYNLYLTDWYADRDTEKAAIADQVRADYIAMLRQLAIAFRSEEESLWLEDVNFDDNFEVSEVIPYYARKLKDIAIYLANKRNTIQRAKLKYNMAGTRDSLERLFYEYLLKAFTKRKFPGNEYESSAISTTALQALPELSAAAQSFQILVDELYDDTIYFDRDPRQDVTAYFNISSNTLVDFLTTANVSPADIEWLYSTGVTQLCADNPLLWVVDDVLNQYKDGIPLSAVETYDSVLLNDYNRINLARKYIGREQFWLSGGFYIPWTQDVSYAFDVGNNWFYWPSGEYIHQNRTDRFIDPLMLSESALIDSGATPGTSYTNSDVIFFRRGNSVSGAWLQSTNQQTITPIMSARLGIGDTVFSFPYPGYGLIGEDVPWSGCSLDNIDITFDYLDADDKDVIYTNYWSTSTNSLTSFTPIMLNSTTLIDRGATPYATADRADRVTIRPAGLRDSIADWVYTGDQQYAYCYKMEKTDLPIACGTRSIYWPLIAGADSIPFVATSAQCIPVALSAVNICDNMLGATAGLDITSADSIIKRAGPGNSRPVNGAWLSGARLTVTNLTDSSLLSAVSQPGITFAINANDIGTFVWEDSNVAATSVFRGYQHQDDCGYLDQRLISLYNDRLESGRDLDYNQWKKCSCRSVVYSPLGHPGGEYTDYDGMADYITMLTHPTSANNLEAWRDSQGFSYKNSSEFGWYKLTGDQVDLDVGWGPGKWVTNSGDDFILSANCIYQYHRSNLNRSAADFNAPYFVSRYKNANSSTRWMKMVYNSTNDAWTATEEPTDLILTPGDYIDYTHVGTFSIAVTSQEITVQERPYKILPSLSDIGSFHVQYGVPMDTRAMTLATPVISGTGSCINVGYNTQTVDIPYQDPTNMISLTGVHLSSGVPTVTTGVTSVSTVDIATITYNTPTSNFVWNTPLSGWNYSTHSFDGVSLGARPFWGKAYDDASQQTKYKGVDVFGGNLRIADDYTFISQPEVSDIQLQTDTYLQYTRVGPGQMVWIQSVEAVVDSDIVQWNKLIIDPTKVPPLSGMLGNSLNELVVSGTHIKSDLVFDVIPDSPLLVNYYANNPFTWTQTLCDSSLGLPPTGGVWVPITSGSLVEPVAPHAHLTNRHYPTIAYMPYVGNLYTGSDSGGYMIPSKLGVSTFLSKKHTHALETLGNISPTEADRGLTRVFQDVDIFTADRGLTKADQNCPVVSVDTDARWMKGAVTEWSKQGMIVTAKDHQEFMPYQTFFEDTNASNIGYRRQGDLYDPWTGSTDSDWENEIDWPRNYRNQVDIQGWYDQFNMPNKYIYKWKTDIFGNDYSLIKPLSTESTIYSKRTALGSIWTRDARNIIQPGIASLADVYNKFERVTISDNIQEFDIWYDTAMFYTGSAIAINKILFDYDTNEITAIADNTHEIILCNAKYADCWFYEEDKRVTLATVASGDSASGAYFYPVLYDLNLENNDITKISLFSSDTTIRSLTSVGLSAYSDLVFTYNYQTKLYNIAFLAYSNAPGWHFVTIDFKKTGLDYTLLDVKCIAPVV